MLGPVALPARSATHAPFVTVDRREAGYASQHEYNEFAVAAVMNNCLTALPQPRPPPALLMAQRAMAATAGMFDFAGCALAAPLAVTHPAPRAPALTPSSVRLPARMFASSGPVQHGAAQLGGGSLGLADSSSHGRGGAVACDVSFVAPWPVVYATLAPAPPAVACTATAAAAALGATAGAAAASSRGAWTSPGATPRAV
ncbi:unnamed protein product [Prorocentrum cordatum]|uniref:Uncharacterized protein n=1 Tax=Prorocentrum cordatum TaxID=2364126 RepID=A0ABN9PFG8_9DINO|nr:unnamed protein product [Polarella glacialis]|mmetsp:Transcript_81701/g.221344  ORF Transcript_81701/g.221344 Transcript_81701/m.221344 type:complete len:200 (+) Transcript_81701:111-710(+)